MGTQIWRQTILELTSAIEYANPFLDVSITAVFIGPSGREIKREAYWDGGCSYNISFAPTELGDWTYTVSAPTETGLDGITGTVECIPYEGDLAIYQHGFLKVESGRRYLMYNDKTPFFWLGDTHWDFAMERERWDESNHPEMDSMYCGMADRRVAQGYNVYQTNLRSEPDMETGISRFWAADREDDLPNLEFYQNELDRRMYYLADIGLVNALGLAWYGAVGTEGEHLEQVLHLTRYIIARYGALPIVWTLCGEYSGFIPGPPRENLIKNWRVVAKYIEELDGYNMLQTAHAMAVLPYDAYYEPEDWFDFSLNQAGHGNIPINSKNYLEWIAEHPSKPFVEGEAMYEGCSTLEQMGPRFCDDVMVRRTAYTAIMNGCCGYTYGAQGIWDSVWDKEHLRPWSGSFNRFAVTWAEAIDFPGGWQMGYMKRFFEQNQFQTLSPIEPVARGGRGFGGGNKQIHIMANEDRSRIVVYYSNFAIGTQTLDQLTDAAYAPKWFNPRTGEYTPCENVTPINGEWTLPPAPDFTDWLLVAERFN